MKSQKIILFHLTVCCTIIFSFTTVSVFAQRSFRQASNCNCYLLTPTFIGAIEWYGSCYDGYCDGNGTVNYYEQSGRWLGKYVGGVTKGKLNGFGTNYNPDGTINYRGHVVDNEFVDRAPFRLVKNIVGDFIVDSLLSGGIKRQCEVTTAIFSTSGQLLELHYMVNCYGQYYQNNFYTCTLVITPHTSPYIRMIDVNDNAQAFITLNFLRYSKRLLDWINKQDENK